MCPPTELSFAFSDLEIIAKIYLPSGGPRVKLFFQKTWIFGIGREGKVTAHEAYDDQMILVFLLTSSQTSDSWNATSRWTEHFSVTQTDWQSQNRKKKTVHKLMKKSWHTYVTAHYSISPAWCLHHPPKKGKRKKIKKEKFQIFRLALSSAIGVCQFLLHHLKQLVCFPSPAGL